MQIIHSVTTCIKCNIFITRKIWINFNITKFYCVNCKNFDQSALYRDFAVSLKLYYNNKIQKKNNIRDLQVKKKKKKIANYYKF